MCLLSESTVAFGPSLLQHGEDSSAKHNRRASLQVKKVETIDFGRRSKPVYFYQKLLLWKNAIWISVIVTGSRAGTGVYSTGTRSVIYVPPNSDLKPKPCGEPARCDHLVLWCMRKCNSGIQQLWDRTYHSVLWRVRDCIGDGRAGPGIKMSNEML